MISFKNTGLTQLLDRIAVIIDRYIHRRQCPYCFNYVTSRVYRLQDRHHHGEVNVKGVSMSMTKIMAYQCPTCKAELPFDFFTNRSSSIALVGGTESGKSSFITIFCELLLNQRSALHELGIFGSIINNEGKEQFEDNHKMLIQQERALYATTDIKAPIIVRLHSKHHKKVTYLTLIDSPGEDFSDKNKLMARHPNLHYANGIIFLMNPLDIADLLQRVRKEKPDIVPPSGRVNTHNFEVIELLYQLYMQTGRIKPNARIKTPTAFCLSRADLLEDITDIYLPSDFDVDLQETDYILDEVELVMEDLKELLEETGGNLLSIMEKRFGKYGIFPVSPLGKAPSRDGTGLRVHGGVDPKGMLQPIIWMLRQTKFI